MEQTAQEGVGEVLQTRETVFVVLMDPRVAAAADGVVRVVVKKKFPCVAERTAFAEGRIARCSCKENPKRFQTEFQRGLSFVVEAFQRRPGGERSVQERCEIAQAHLLRHHGQTRFRLLTDTVKERTERGLAKSRKSRKELEKILLRLQMIDPVHQQAV